ncbi:TetR/AcrR family transcriptional regulator [Chitinophaga costaii]|uniref:TetR/AcrR family transcriptional regulator n=1 Tax=Chitinophaga costaii TaxID=1335309 RepID=UPI0021CDBBDD|nr:TetR/AcrR family transcriptional regulator [Chitinophaga costaii]
MLQAAKHLFQLHGFRRVTIDDIAKAIGKARSSLYYYYKTKEEILDAVMANEIKELMAAIVTAVKQAPTSEEKIKVFFQTKLKIILGKKGFFNALDEGMDSTELFGYQKIKMAVHQQIWEQETALLSQLIREEISRGEFTKQSQKDQEELIFVLHCSLRGLKREMVIRNDFGRITSSIRILIRSIMEGIKV